jgi:hypothetical protein
MRSLLKSWITPGAKLTPEELHQTVRLVVRFALILLAMVALLAGALALWGGRSAASYQGTDFLTRSVLAWGKWIQALLAGWLGFEALDSSGRGKWLMHWDRQDDAYTQAAKTLSSALILAAFLLGAAFVFAGGL